MGITVQWDNEAQAIMRCEYTGYWGAVDYRMAVEEMVRLVHSVEGRVDGIIVYQDSRTTTNPIWLGQYLFAKVPDRGGVYVFVNADRFTRTTLDIWKGLYGMEGRFFLADSVEEARAIIAAQRSETAVGAGGSLPCMCR
jgi:hypothetical protein